MWSVRTEVERVPNGLQLRMEIFTYRVSTSVLMWLVVSDARLPGPSLQQSEKCLEVLIFCFVF